MGAGVACRWCFQDVDRPLFIASAATCLASMATWMRIHSKLVDMSQASWFMQNYRLGGSILSVVGVIHAMNHKPKIIPIKRSNRDEGTVE